MFKLKSIVLYIYVIYQIMISSVLSQNNIFNQFSPNSLLNQFSSTCPSFSFLSSNTVFSSEMELSLAVSAIPLTYKNFKLPNAAQILTDDNYVSQYKTIIFIHGYLDFTTSPLALGIVNTYKNIGGHNVIVFDTKNQELGIYFNAVQRAVDVGKQLGTAVAQMQSSGFDVNNLELIGHSLGCHIAGYAAKTFNQLTGRKLPTIIALDPAGPCYSNADPSARLNENNGDSVQALYTNAGSLGASSPMGSVNIYVNGGQNQPGCVTSICSHVLAITYWLAAVENPTYFKAQKCPNLPSAYSKDCNGEEVTVGPQIDRNARGIFHTDKYGSNYQPPISI